jgi:hypothetical protein
VADRASLAGALILAMQPGGRARDSVVALGLPLGADLTAFADALAVTAIQHQDDQPRVEVGSVLYGYCGGIFGDFYGDKVVEAIGSGWVVVRTEGLAILGDIRPEQLVEYLDPDNWSDK